MKKLTKQDLEFVQGLACRVTQKTHTPKLTWEVEFGYGSDSQEAEDCPTMFRLIVRNKSNEIINIGEYDWYNRIDRGTPNLGNVAGLCGFFQHVINQVDTTALSKVQQEVVDQMKAGWELGINNSGFHTRPWLQKGGLGKGGEIQRVPLNSFNSLNTKRVIKSTG